MKTKKINFTFILVVFIFSLFSCEKEENEKKVSSFFENESHNSGKNCMECHKSGGQGEGIFKVAGTVYEKGLTNPYANAKINFYTEKNGGGELKYSIEGDNLGNFYTTENIDLSIGLYVAVEGSVSKYMLTEVPSGECNSCHGSSMDKIWTE